MMKIKSSKRAVAAFMALVMVLCMAPLAAFAAGATVAIDEDATTYDPSTGSVTLSAAISDKGADVTVLVIKTSTKITLAQLAAMSDKDIQDAIAYIDQDASNGDTGVFAKTFKLREGVSGSRVAIAVGGKGVSSPDFYEFSTLMPPATLTASKDVYVGNDDTVEFTVGSNAPEWNAAIDSAVVKVDGTVVDGGASIDSNVLVVADPLVFALDDETDEKTFTLTIEVEGYDTVTKEVKVIAPTTALYNDLLTKTVAVEYEDGDLLEGDALVTLPTFTEYYGAAIAWSVVEDNTIDTTGAVVNLPRDENEAVTYTLKATITKAGYKAQEKTYPFTVNALGVAGVEVDITLDFGTNVNAANLATVTVDSIAAVQDGTDKSKFTTGTLSAGEYTAVVARPGYVTFTITFTVDADGVIAADADKVTDIAMVAGDVDDNGVIDLDDFLILNDAFNKTSSDEGYDVRSDFDATGEIDLDDFLLLNDNFNYGV